MKLTKKQRHELYKKAMELRENDKYLIKEFNLTPKRQCGICALIYESMINLNYPEKYIHTSLFLELLPELKSIKPKKERKDRFWWSRETYSIRDKKLKQLIEMTK